ncbi:MAG: crotonase/enoyl-CoA hydratase family protein [SAR324 cluster bacterium]|nr:crotonase/enoyl-CoA hydratase family protein [SAR324 cluster bacterium]MBL7035170.1 crotonase/enoyl-CoA hydratase family protein [SAR324 cluster bacterium]
MTELLSINIADSVAEIKLNRPDKANALNEELWLALGDCFSELSENESVRVCILSGTGDHFCSGIDLGFLQAIGQEVDKIECEGRKRDYLRQKIIKLQAAFTQIEDCRKPVLAAVHGGCIGGGLDLISACDMRYSTHSAVFQIKEIDLGLTADIGSLQRLPHLIPQGVVRELAYTGRKFSGEEARELCLINCCYEDRQILISEVRKIAAQIAAKAPLALRGVKEMLLHARDHSVADGLNYVATWNSAMLLSADLEESMMSMLQNRPPEFKD